MVNSKTVTKEDKKNLEKKLGEVLGLERVAQKAVDELTSMNLIKLGAKDEVKKFKMRPIIMKKKYKESFPVFLKIKI